MALPSIGAHCSLSSCNLNDFLPIRCQCNQLFCRDHIAPDKHACPNLTSASTLAAGSEETTRRARCAATGCNKPTLESAVATDVVEGSTVERVPAACPACGLHFCAIHRHATSHGCQPHSKPNFGVRNAAARALLAKNFPSTASRPSYGKGIVPGKPATKVELMKMRHRALVGDPKDSKSEISLEQRIYVNVTMDGDNTAIWEVYWFRKTTITGKALDLLASHFKVATAGPLTKVEPDGTKPILRTDLPLSDQVQDGSFLVLKL